MTEAAQSAAAAGVVLVFVFVAAVVFAFVVELEFVGALVQPDNKASITASASAINIRFGVSDRGLITIESSFDFGFSWRIMRFAQRDFGFWIKEAVTVRDVFNPKSKI